MLLIKHSYKLFKNISMKRKLDFIFTTIIGFLGIVHVSLTSMFYDSMNEEASIFIVMGLAFFFQGALSLERLLVNIKNH